MALRAAVQHLDGQPTDDARLPANACAHEQGRAIALHLHDLGKAGVQPLTHQAAGLGQDLVKVVGPQGKLTELGPHGSLVQQRRAVARRRNVQQSRSMSMVR